MKKYLIVVLLALTATGAFAVDLVAGIVLNTLSGSGSREIEAEGSGGSNRTYSYDYTASGAAFGFFGSVGWKVFDINVAVLFGNAPIKVTDSEVSESGKAELEKKPLPLNVVQLGLWFKIPITISKSFRLFPMLGTDINYGTDYGFGLIPGTGLGADILLFRNMFLRASVLGGAHINFGTGGNLFGFGLSFKAGAGWLL